MAEGTKSPRSLLRHPPFRTLWVAQLVSVFGDFLMLFGVISLITFRLHRTPSDVAFAIASYLLPLSLLAPFAGVLVDRWNVKRVMIASDLLRAGIAATFVFVSDTRQIDLAMALLGLFSSFFGPAQSVALRILVAPADLLAANALLAQAFYAVRILSPAIAGALVAALTEKACFWADAASFLFSAAMIGRLSIARPQAAGQEHPFRGLGRDFLEGNRFIFKHRGLSLAFLASAAAMFMLSSFSPLISVYVRDTLHAREMVYGGISSMIGVGLIVGTQAVRQGAKDAPIARLVVGGLFALGVGAALLGAFQNVVAAASSTLIIGGAIAVVVVPAQTLTQKETPPTMMGRVSSTFMSLFSVSQVLGLLLSGALATWLGIRPLFLVCGAILILLAAAGASTLRPPPKSA
jgi:MFS family permease